MDPHLAGALLGASIAGAFAIFAGFLANQARTTEWFRDKLVGFYSNALYYLVKLAISADDLAKLEEEVGSANNP